ncbi:MAG: hypothetical protein KGI67_06855 [Pseudomonadota bacterium]|nr:hypothetical protein [Pseudomonadota bacterium]
MLSRSRLIRVGGLLLLLGLSPWLERPLGEGLLPLLRAAVAQFSGRLVPTGLSLVQSDHQWVYALQARTGPGVMVGQLALPPGLEMSSSTLLGHAVQSLLLACGAVLLWPHLEARRRLAALGLLAIFVSVALCLDVPLVLLGSLWDLLAANFAPGWKPLIVRWMDLMNGGGRLALSLAAAALAVWCAGAARDRARAGSGVDGS